MHNFIPIPDMLILSENENDCEIHIKAERANPSDIQTCPHCGCTGKPTKHSSKYKTLRDLPVNGKPVEIQFFTRAYRCKACGGFFAEDISSFANRSMTTRLRNKIALDPRPAMTIAIEYGIDRRTVSLIKKEYSLLAKASDAEGNALPVVDNAPKPKGRPKRAAKPLPVLPQLTQTKIENSIETKKKYPPLGHHPTSKSNTPLGGALSASLGGFTTYADKPNTCPICGKTFTRTTDWVYYRKMPNGGRYYLCSYSCGRKYDALQQETAEEVI